MGPAPKSDDPAPAPALPHSSPSSEAEAEAGGGGAAASRVSIERWIDQVRQASRAAAWLGETLSDAAQSSPPLSQESYDFGADVGL